MTLPPQIHRFTSHLLRGIVIVNRPRLQKVSWDLFFGVCHFCSFEIVNLADSPTFPEEYFFVCEINSIKIVYMFIIYSTERPV